MGASSKPSQAAERYASALFDLGVETGAVAVLEADAKALLGALTLSPDLARVLASPLVPAEEKAGALAAVATAMGLSQTTANLLGVMARNGRAGDIAGALTAYRALAAKARGAARADVAAAAPLGEAQAAALQSALESAFKRQIEMDVTVKPDLLGGFVVKVGSKMFDASVRSKLDALKTAMKGA